MSLILVTGGARAGKSTFAEALAHQLAGDNVCFVATAEALDADMAARIAAHRAARPAGWLTLEAPRNVAGVLEEHGGWVIPYNAVLIDCLTLLVSNVLLSSAEDVGVMDVWPAVEAEVAGIVRFARGAASTTIVVTNEVGLGVVPPTPLGRVYRDLLGKANQLLAAATDEVYLVVAGIPVEIKALAARRPGETR
jgi:adenosylcobinamide kinase/adenosylcobinamide-phosphate guanylyltransferase